MKSSAPIQSWKYHGSILTGAILIIVVGALIRNLSHKKTEHAETSMLQALQTEVPQLKTSLKRNDLEAISDLVALATKKAAPAVGRETYFLAAGFPSELDGHPTINRDGQKVGLNVFRRDLGKGVGPPWPHALAVAQAICTDEAI